MITSDIPKLPQQPQYIIERPFAEIAEKDCASNDFANLPQPEAPDLGGYPFVTTSGTTVASGTSLSTVRTYQITFIPRDGVIPSYVLELHRVARSLEQVVNPTERSIK